MSNNLKNLDANQVLRSVYDVDLNTLRVSIVDGSSGGGGSLEVVISHLNDSIRLGNGTSFITTTTIGPKVSLDTNIINTVATTVSNFPAIQPVSGPLTNTELRASPVPVTGSVGITGTGNALAINGNGEITVQATGTVRVNNNYTTHYAGVSSVGDIFGAQDINEYSQVNFTLRAGFVASVQIRISVDNVDFYPTLIYSEDGSAPSFTVTQPGNYYFPVNGRYFKPTVTSYTSGTVICSTFVSSIPRALNSVAVSNFPAVQTVTEELNDNHVGKRKFAEVTAVAANIETTIVSHTAAIGKRTFITRIGGSGDNVAKFIIRLNGTQIDVKRTSFGAQYNVEFNFDGTLAHGMEIDPADVITVSTIHQSGLSDFNGDIQLVEVT